MNCLPSKNILSISRISKISNSCGPSVACTDNGMNQNQAILGLGNNGAARSIRRERHKNTWG